MTYTILAIGKLSQTTPEAVLIGDYVRRLRGRLDIREFAEKRGLPPGRQKESESALLSAAIPDDAKVIVLDERGTALSSRELAAKIRAWRDQGAARVCFCIGGADGHADALKKRADLILSFGRLTMPHMLARVVLAEQIYRLQTILDNHPYHRD
ncbi:MAG: 23S rRNA (pseudouridine(1915)-N(3))-methyltransferase RlmH [Alphaproteobacteria bacterium]|nr:23S rRNA (pseudouridine(1915)-N(3))-methyltransferase RlmH [Alphaproteobacteria bacterium]